MASRDENTQKTDVYLESGKKRTFACAVDWPGWCRSGKDEASALQALVDYGARYAIAIQTAGLDFRPPADPAAFHVVERLEGDMTTDFGAPAVIPSIDARPVDETERQRLEALLKAIWQAFDTAAAAALGKDLRKGPRGGGRELDGVVEHVFGAETNYLSALGWKRDKKAGENSGGAMAALRQAILEGMGAAVRGEIPRVGPRGGTRWPLRYYVRRAAWHILDHAWEIQDRVVD